MTRFDGGRVAIAFTVTVMIALLSISLGATNVSIADVFRDSDSQLIILQLRLPRTILGFLVGAGLALVGVVYQALFRNPLASPFSLGVSSGAAIGASCAILFGIAGSFGTAGVTGCSIIGALLSIAMILHFNRRRRTNETSFLLLAGVVFSFFCSSVLTLLQYVSNQAELFKVTRWMMGGLVAVSWAEIAIVALVVGLVALYTVQSSRELDLLLFGEEMARTKGVDVRRAITAHFLGTSLIVGVVVAMCGVIGFVGIIVPAIARLFTGERHGRMVPLAMLLGGNLVVLCDLIGRLVIPPFEIPVGVFTAILGGPVFMWLLSRTARGKA